MTHPYVISYNVLLAKLCRRFNSEAFLLHGLYFFEYDFIENIPLKILFEVKGIFTEHLCRRKLEGEETFFDIKFITFM